MDPGAASLMRTAAAILTAIPLVGESWWPPVMYIGGARDRVILYYRIVYFVYIYARARYDNYAENYYMCVVLPALAPLRRRLPDH